MNAPRATRPVALIVVALLAFAGHCLGQPVITQQPAPQAAAPGTSVAFEVGASGVAPLAYQWQNDPICGFPPLAGRTNAALVLTNVQPWDAGDYRVVVSNLTGAKTSAVAQLYVVTPSWLTTNAAVDSFDDNRLSGWVPEGHLGQVKLSETNRQFRVWGYWPGVNTMGMDLANTESYGSLNRGWTVPNGQTMEWRVDLVALNEHATMAGFALWSESSSAAYVLFKGHDFIHLCKPSVLVPERHAHFFHDQTLVRDSNVVLSLAVTRVNPNVIVTVRILDKEKNDAVLYERSAVDTPGIDRTLSRSELESVSGMQLHTARDVGAPIVSGSAVFLTVFQYNDGIRPPAEAVFDNLERRTSVFPVWRPALSMELTSTIPPQANLKLSAPPNSSWVIERAPELTGPWTDWTDLRIGTNGSVQFSDTHSPNAARFYRARLQ